MCYSFFEDEINRVNFATRVLKMSVAHRDDFVERVGGFRS